MNDPYSILGVDPNASDDEIKRAYRELARKYHPDNYQNNPLADLAEEKMKEVNEAYEAINKMRSGGGGGGYQSAYQQSGYRQSGYQQSSYSSGNSLYARVRQSINLGNLSQAEELLSSAHPGCRVALSHGEHRLPEGLAGRSRPAVSDRLQHGPREPGVPAGVQHHAAGGTGLSSLRLQHGRHGFHGLLYHHAVSELPLRRVRALR